MKKTGRRVYLSGQVSFEESDAVIAGPNTYFQNILVDERRGYAYKVTYISAFPDVTQPFTPGNVPFALQSFSRRELLRMSQAQLELHSGARANLGGGTLAQDNRTIGIYGYTGERAYVDSNYQNQYVIKGDAMVTQSLSLCVDMQILGQTASKATYYIELDEYEVSDNEEILLLLAERAQDARGLSQ